MPSDLILEQDALLITQYIDSMPEAEKLKAADVLKRYRVQQETAGAGLFPSLAKQQVESREKLWSAFDNPKTLDNENGVYAEADRLESGLGDNLRVSELQARFLSHRYGQPLQKVRDEVEHFATDYSAKNWGEAVTDPAQFFAKAKADVTKERDEFDMNNKAFREATLAAMDGANLPLSLAKWQEQAAKKPGFSAGQSSLYMERYNTIARTLEKHRPAIDSYMEATQRTMQGKAGETDGATMAAFRETLLDMPPNEQDLAMRAIAAKALKLGKTGEAKNGIRGFFQETGESFGRFAAGDTIAVENALSMVPESPGRITTSIKAIETPEQARAFVKEQASQNMAQNYAAVSSSGTAGVPRIAPAGPERELTSDEAKLVSAAKEREQKGIDLDRKIKRIAEQTDPVTGAVSGTLGPSLGIMAAMLATRGAALPVIAQTYASNNYNDIRLDNPDIEPQKARQIALASGAAEATLDLWDIKILTKLPTVAGLLKNGLKRETLTSAARNVGGAYLAENIQEASQDLVLPLLKTAMASDAPSVDFEQDLRAFAQSRGDVALAILPLVLIGGGVATARDYLDFANIEKTNQKLGEAGFIEPDRVTILDAMKTGNAEVVDAAIVDASPRRMVEVAAEWQDKAGEKARADMQATAAAQELLDRQGYTLRRDGEGWSLRTPDGATVKTATAEEAVGLLQQDFSEGQLRNAQAVADMADVFLSQKRGGERIEVQPGKSRDIRDDVAEGNITPEQAREAIVTAGKLAGLTEEESMQQIGAVLGSSTVEENEGVREAVSRIYKGGDAMTVVEETIEGRWKKGLKDGRYTPEQGAGWVRLAEQATGESYLPESHSERDLVEAISYIIKADVMGRARDGSRLAPGVVSRGLVAARKMGAAEAKEEGKFKAFLDSWREWAKRVFGTARKLSKARAEGKLTGDFETLLDDLLGIDAQTRYEAEAVKVAEDWVDDAGMVYAPADGETFALGRGLGTMGVKPMAKQQREAIQTTEDGATIAVSPDDIQTIPEDLARAEADAAKAGEGWAESVDLSQPVGAFRDESGALRIYDGHHRWLAAKMRGEKVNVRVKDYTEGMKETVLPDGARLIGPTTFSLAEYAGNHRPNNEGPRVFNLLEGGISPSDVYEHPEWYSAMEPGVIRETMAQLRKVKGNPNAKLTIYRAGPKGEMNGGDWVSLSKQYARTHAESQDPESFKVWQAQVAAESVRWSLDDLAEFGYFGESVAAKDSGITFSLTAYHGTPHKIPAREGFRLDKIGTGEGAQAYGWGLYFAESEDVAASYQKLAKPFATIDGKPLSGAVGSPAAAVALDLQTLDGDKQAVLDGFLNDGMPAEAAWLKANFDRVGFERPGNLYTVELLPDEGDFLDWDKPLSEQSEKVRDELFVEFGSLYDESKTGGEWYQGLTKDDTDPKTLSEDLARIGIPGIRYLDAGSRVFKVKLSTKKGPYSETSFPSQEVAKQYIKDKEGEGFTAELVQDGTRNYVIFDEKLVKILEENGKPVAQPSYSLARRNLAAFADTKMAAMMEKPEFKEAMIRVAAAKVAELRAERSTDNSAELQSLAEQAILKGRQRAFDNEAQSAKRVASLESWRSAIAAEAITGVDAKEIENRETAYQEAFREAEAQHLAALDEIQERLELDLGYDAANEPNKAKRDLLTQKLKDKAKLDSEKEKSRWKLEAAELESAHELAIQSLTIKTKEAARAMRARSVAMIDKQIRAEKARAKLDSERAKSQAAVSEQRFSERAKSARAKEGQMQALRLLDAILSAFPAEIRGRVGGFVKLASLGTDKAREAEIGRRLDKLDVELEKFAKKHFVSELDKLLEKVAPKGGGGEKAMGKIGVAGHRWFEIVNDALPLTEQQAQDEMVKLESILADAEREAEHEDAFERWGILHQFGGFGEKSAAEMETALETARDVASRGREAWKAIMEERKAFRVAGQQGALKELGGKANWSKTQAKAAKEADKGQAEKMGDFMRRHFSFVQILQRIFGRGPTAQRYENAARAATRKKTDAMVARIKNFKSGMMQAVGGKTWRETQAKLYELQQIQNNAPVRFFDEPTTKTLEVPGVIAARLAGGTMTPKAAGLTDAEAESVADEWAKSDNKNRVFEVKQRIPGAVQPTNDISQNQAIHFTMLAKQESYREAMDRHGITAETLEDLEKWLTPEAKAVRAWLFAQYDAGYYSLNEVYKRMFGIDLPRVKEYAPGYFEKEGASTAVDPFGSGVETTGLAAGFLKKRKNHMSRPEQVDALQAYWQHTQQTEHWKAWAELTGEMRSVLGNKEVMRTVKAKAGSGAAADLSNWIDILEQNGVKDAQANAVLAKVMRAQARTALAFKLGVLMKQLPATLGSLSDIGAKEWISSARRVLSGSSVMSAQEMFNTPTIQRRIESGYSPEMRVAMQGPNAKPDALGDVLEWGMERVAWTDAAFTSFSAAVAFDAHYRAAQAALGTGVSDVELRKVALEQTENTVGRTAQPGEVMDRSLVELQTQGFGKLMFMFQSAQRQAWALVHANVSGALQGQVPKSEAAKVVFTQFILIPAITQTMSGLIRYLFSDDEPEEAWKVEDYLYAMLLGPSSGIMMMGAALDVLGSAYAPRSNNPLSGAMGDVKRLISDMQADRDVSAKDIGSAVTGAAILLSGYVNPSVEAAGVTWSVLKQALGLADRVGGTE